MFTLLPAMRRAGTPRAGHTAMRFVVVTGVESGVLDPGSGQRTDAQKGLDFLAARGIPLVIHSTRTRAEIERLLCEWHLSIPFISESGGALHVPGGWLDAFPLGARRVLGCDVFELGKPHDAVVDAVREAGRQARTELVLFADLSIEQVSRELIVSLAQARLAKLREYSELFRIVDGSPEARGRVAQALARQGLACTRVGAHYLASAGRGRVDGLHLLRAVGRDAWADPLLIGLGDSDDDAGWLHEVDVAVIVRCPGRGVAPRLVSEFPNAYVTSASGAAGWSEAVLYLLGGLSR